jgi:hypothetical protein
VDRDRAGGRAVSAADRAIRVSTAAAVVGVAGVAAYVSYWHAYEVVRAHGESGVTARREPATIDGLVYASSMVVLYAARHRLAVPALARWLLGLGIVATLGASVAHGWHAGPIGAAVAAWPAASLVGSYELLLWLVRAAAGMSAARGLVRLPGPGPAARRPAGSQRLRLRPRRPGLERRPVRPDGPRRERPGGPADLGADLRPGAVQPAPAQLGARIHLRQRRWLPLLWLPGLQERLRAV